MLRVDQRNDAVELHIRRQRRLRHSRQHGGVREAAFVTSWKKARVKVGSDRPVGAVSCEAGGEQVPSVSTMM